MSNGDDERRPEDDVPLEAAAPARVTKTRAAKKKTTTKHTAKTAVAKTPASNAVAMKTRRSTIGKRSKRTTTGYTRVRLGDNEMFVSREIAGALTKKDLKRLETVFKRTHKRARKRAAKQKA